MILTKISRSKSFEMVNGYGLKSWDKFGLEADITTGEDPIQLYKELDAIIEQYFKESYPDNPNQERVKQVEEKQLPDEVAAIMEGIKNSPDITELKSWWLKSKGNLVLSSAYKLKEKTFTDAK